MTVEQRRRPARDLHALPADGHLRALAADRGAGQHLRRRRVRHGAASAWATGSSTAPFGKMYFRRWLEQSLERPQGRRRRERAGAPRLGRADPACRLPRLSAEFRQVNRFSGRRALARSYSSGCWRPRRSTCPRRSSPGSRRRSGRGAGRRRADRPDQRADLAAADPHRAAVHGADARPRRVRPERRVIVLRLGDRRRLRGRRPRRGDRRRDHDHARQHAGHLAAGDRRRRLLLPQRRQAPARRRPRARSAATFPG